MMRINDHQVIQLIDAQDRADDRLVFVDDHTGTELTIGKADWPLMFRALEYLTAVPGPQYTVFSTRPSGNAQEDPECCASGSCEVCNPSRYR